jgi:hypothetical protein
MTDDMPLPFDLPAVRRKKLTVDFEGGNQSSDDGLLLLRQGVNCVPPRYDTSEATAIPKHELCAEARYYGANATEGLTRNKITLMAAVATVGGHDLL